MQYLLCVNDSGFEASLEKRKVYLPLDDAAAGQRGFVRIVDETGEDYLFPTSYFVPIAVPTEAQAAFAES